MTKDEFLICHEFILDNFGISMSLSKKHILDIKISKLMKLHGANNIRDYLRMLNQKNSRQLIIEFLDEITVNKTNFFREMNHFNYIKGKIDTILSENKRILLNKEIRVWSSACSTGEEPYTLAMILKEVLPPEVKIKILATDISHDVLKKAMTGIYRGTIAAEVPPYYLQEYFVKDRRGKHSYVISDEIKSMVTFRAFNLKQNFVFKNNFDIIFCRNVMIYFDLDFQERLISKFYNVNQKGGMLFIGHSESLSQIKHKYTYVQPTIYAKKM